VRRLVRTLRPQRRVDHVPDAGPFGTSAVESPIWSTAMPLTDITHLVRWSSKGFAAPVAGLTPYAGQGVLE
jgi:hypothetical protein